MTRRKRCGECGSNHVSHANVKGRTFPYKTYSAVELSVDLELNVCQECSNIIYAKGDAHRLDEAIKASLIHQSETFIGNIIKQTGWKQKELASYLGYTSVYISELKNGKKVADLKTFNYLKVLSECEGAIECIVNNDARCDRPGYLMQGFSNPQRRLIDASDEIEYAMVA